MSTRTEWTVTHWLSVDYTHHTDNYGTTSDGPALLLTGDGITLAIEGTPDDVRGREKPGARYFVLDYANDPAARMALRVYANAVRDTKPGLAAAIYDHILGGTQ